ncbi:MAG: PEP-CTERM-box response regulator transcription factor [Burkholderiales bacterium PBB5]|nr:MAG: PEP-CTERM-box response regulator transcription factor [Burkholderiales bacterium PBB5]
MSAGQSSPLLIVEDDLGLQKQIKWSLDRFDSVTAADRDSALIAFRRHQPSVVTMDLGLPPDPDSTSEGFKLLEQLLALDPNVKVIVLTGQNDLANALRAVALGAYDFFAKPFEPELLGLTIERAYRLAELQGENRRLQLMHQPDALGGLITRDPEMLRIGRMVERVASSDATVMLLGESGTGKEVLAQGLHQASKRSGKFVAINCAAIPEALLESELFGYERGAFTGATKTTIGKIETANGGTLMLDEIGDLPHPLQAKLLRFLQERKVERIGGRQEIPVDVRVVCATHQNLKAQIAENRFREDLFYRLAEIVVDIPALRQRVGDAVLLGHAFLRRFAQENKRGAMTFTDDALRAIEKHAWPGNVRELLSAVRRAVIMADGNRVSAADLGLKAVLSETTEGTPAPSPASDLDLRTVREAAERQAVLAALARTDSNIARAAELLGVSRPTLYDLMHRLAIK